MTTPPDGTADGASRPRPGGEPSARDGGQQPNDDGERREPGPGQSGGDGDDSWLFGLGATGRESARSERERQGVPIGGRTYVKPEFSREELAGLAAGPTVAPRRVLPLDDEPSSLVGRYLFPTERYRGEWKRHPIHLIKPISIAAGATLALGFLSGLLAGDGNENITAILFIAWLAVMGWVGWEVVDWFCDRFILTNKRVMVINGIVTRKVAMMPLARVTDMKFGQSPLGRMLNYGTFVLESAGQDQALREVKHLPNPNELYLRVVEEMYEPNAVEARLSSSNDDGEEDDGI
ncbi:PH domain-containing protein [Pilimelia columellifera]|uniref:YdbS-like PH domain-containing protein n=1 Tax=Pilimelia columellifera subsp. columellifera TaxID=706583 RepID=A0ABN3NHK9_9ACTN